MDTPDFFDKQALDADLRRRQHIASLEDATSMGDTRLCNLYRDLFQAEERLAMLCRKQARLMRQADPRAQTFMQRMGGNRTFVTSYGAPRRS